MSGIVIAGGVEVTKPSEATGDFGPRFDKNEHEGRLVAFVEPEAREVDSQYGTATAASCDFVVVLEGDDAPTVYEDQLIFGAVLAPTIYNGGRVVVGRIGRAADAKPGRSRAWILNDPTDEELASVQKWADDNLTVKNGRLVVQL